MEKITFKAIEKYRKTISKNYIETPQGRISALQALLIITIHHVALISLCHSSDRRDDLSGFACNGLSTKTRPPSIPCTFS